MGCKDKNSTIKCEVIKMDAALLIFGLGMLIGYIIGAVITYVIAKIMMS